MIRIFLSLLLISFAVPPMAFARTEGIAAVVNQDAISMTDLNDRLHLVLVSSGLPPSDEIKQKLLGQVLNDLVEEQLKMQETKRIGISVSPEEVAQGFAALAAQNKFTPEQFRDIILKSGINISTIERQITSQIGWSKIIQQEMRPRVTVTDGDIDDYIARLTSAKGKPEYQVAEIFLPVTAETPEADTQQLAHKLVKEMKAGAPFFKVAQQFSGAAGATRGGDLGWIQQGQLDPALDSALTGMAKESLSEPVRTTNGYHILFLRDTRVISEETILSREQILSTIGIQRLERLQERQLLDLKTTAFIENRVQS